MNNDSFTTEFENEKIPGPQKASSTKGIVGFVLGLSCIITCCVPFIGEYLMLGLSIASIALSSLQFKQKPTGLAIAGLVLGIVFLVLALIAIMFSTLFGTIIDDLIENINTTTASFNLFIK